MYPLLVTIPHSGEVVPPEVHWLQNLEESVLMGDVDRYVDRLYKPALEFLKIPYIATQWHRYVVDLNRLSEDVDADSVAGHANPSGKYPRGLHWVFTTKGIRLMPTPIPMEFHKRLVEKYFNSFHSQILRFYEKHKDFKNIFHMDVHSMPSQGTNMHRDPGDIRAEAVISDQKGRSCSAQFRDLVVASYETAGFRVKLNWPYIGGRITEYYGKPEKGRHTIQIELNRALYMDEKSLKWIDSKAEKVQFQLQTALDLICKGLKNES